MIRGRSDSNYATDKDTQRSVTGTLVYLNKAPIVFGIVTQKHVTLSVTEAELASRVSLVQDMMYVYRVVTSMGRQVKLPMLVEMVVMVMTTRLTSSLRTLMPRVYTTIQKYSVEMMK